MFSLQNIIIVNMANYTHPCTHHLTALNTSQWSFRKTGTMERWRAKRKLVSRS